MDPMMGEIRLFPYNFAPRQWLACQGQVLPIAQYEALFSLVGTQFGGDGTTNFALPDLRQHAPLAGPDVVAVGYCICFAGEYPPRP
jgi:microcystin-dependent protein